MFEKLSEAHIEKIYEYLSNDNTDDTTYTALSVLAWMKPGNPDIKIDDKYITIKFIHEGEEVYLTPLVKDKNNFEYAVNELHSFKAKKIVGVLDWQVDAFKKLGYTVEYSKDNSEYLYDPEKMITLSGKKLHSKRNFINQFPEKYEFRSYNGSEEDFNAVWELFCKWCHWRTDGDVKPCKDNSWRKSPAMVEAGYDLEADALEMMLKDHEKYKCFTDILIVKGKVAGFVSGEVMPNGVGVIYFEKGDVSYRGVYPLIDNLF